jgi:internalin A
MNPPANHDVSTSRPRRRGLRLSLGALIVLVLVVGAGMGWIAHEARVQREAVAAIRKAQGVVFYDGFKPTRQNPTKPPSRVPKWLRKGLGDDTFDTVTFVQLGPGSWDRRLMSEATKLKSLEELWIINVPPDLEPDEILKIRHLSQMKVMHISTAAKFTALFLSAATDLKQLRDLQIARGIATDADLKRIGRLNRIEFLTVGGQDITDDGFSHLANLTHMKRLRLPGCTVSDLSALREMPDLEHLNFTGLDAQIVKPRRLNQKPIDVGPLVGKTKLSQIQLGPIPILDDDLRALAALPKLTHITAGGQHVTDSGLACLSSAPKLVAITIYDLKIRNLGTLSPPLLGRLGALALPGASVTSGDFSSLSNATKLFVLDLEGSNIDDAGVAYLANAVGVSELRLSGTQVTDDGLTHLSGMARLRLLDLKNTRVTGVGFSRFTGRGGPQILLLDQSSVTDDGLAHVAKLRSVTRLDLNQTAITDAGLSHLAAMARLQSVSLKNTRITGVGLAHLVKCTRLTQVDISQTRITEAELLELAKLRPRFAINVTDTPITKAGLEHLHAEFPDLRVVILQQRNTP